MPRKIYATARREQCNTEADMTVFQFKEYLAGQLPADKLDVRHGLSVIFPYDLRGGMKGKLSECDTTKRWTAFVNNNGTLCHVIGKGAEIIIRIKFKSRIDHLSVEKMFIVIMSRIDQWVQM